jgi:hypothetical protein
MKNPAIGVRFWYWARAMSSLCTPNNNLPPPIAGRPDGEGDGDQAAEE